MIDESDHPERIREKLSIDLSSIYDDLSTKYDRLISRTDLNDPDDIIGEIIENYWNIPKSIIDNDLEYEKERQKRNKIGIPDIPTYRIRFAIEEGSWSVLLRDNFRIHLRDEFNRLLTLEELIWETGAGTIDDLAYYLLELLQIGEKWIDPISNLWLQHHDYGTLEDFAPLIIAAYHQTSLSRGLLMFEGGKRLLSTKLNRLIEIGKINHSSNWTKRAEDIVDLLISEEELENKNQLRMKLVITLSLLQKEVRTAAKQSQSSNEHDSFDPEFNWSNFDPSNLQDKEEFSEFIIRKLYLQEEVDPLDAAEAIIRNLLGNLNYSSHIINSEVNNFRRKIELLDGMIIDNIQSKLPKLFIRLREEEKLSNAKEANLKNIDDLPTLHALIDSIRRVKFIQEEEISLEIVKKAVSSTYKTLISYRIDPIQASNKIIQTVINNFELATNEQEELKKSIDQFKDEIDMSEESLTKVDINAITILTEGIHTLASKKKL